MSCWCVSRSCRLYQDRGSFTSSSWCWSQPEVLCKGINGIQAQQPKLNLWCVCCMCRWVELRRKPPSERKLALLLYGFPPGVGATGTAALLNVPKSIEKMIAALQVRGGGSKGRCLIMKFGRGGGAGAREDGWLCNLGGGKGREQGKTIGYVMGGGGMGGLECSARQTGVCG
jgi:hypothetical protein